MLPLKVHTMSSPCLISFNTPCSLLILRFLEQFSPFYLPRPPTLLTPSPLICIYSFDIYMSLSLFFATFCNSSRFSLVNSSPTDVSWFWSDQPRWTTLATCALITLSKVKCTIHMSCPSTTIAFWVLMAAALRAGYVATLSDFFQ